MSAIADWLLNGPAPAAYALIAALVFAEAAIFVGFVLPGETAYVVITPSAVPQPTGRAALTGVTAAGPEAPWYSQVWGSVKAADRPAPLPTPTPAAK